LNPDTIPWDALRVLMGESIYGGKVDNDFDQRLLMSFLSQFLNARSYNADYPLAFNRETNQPILTIPDATNRQGFLNWIIQLPDDAQSPEWLGLPAKAERFLLANRALRVLTKVLKLQSVYEEAEVPTSGKAKDAKDRRPAWMRSLHITVQNWMKKLPESLKPLERTQEKIKDPLFRCFEREVAVGSRLLKTIQNDLKDVIKVCEGEKKLTNYLRELTNNFTRGIVPKSWKKYSVPDAVPVNVWLIDFVQRIDQLKNLTKSSNYLREGIWLGGLFFTEAYITATRQAAAQANGWALESLELVITNDTKIDTLTFIATNMNLEGASWKNNQVIMGSDIASSLPPLTFKWIMIGTNTRPKNNLVSVPVYLNDTRAELLFPIDLEAPSGITAQIFYQRAVALLTTSFKEAA